MTGEEDTRSAPGALTEEQAERMFAAMNEVIRAGEEMRELRTGMIQVLAGLGWTQDRIARLAGMSQPAVSKQAAKHRTGEPPAPMALSLDQHDAPWLEGRLWGLAEAISETLGDAARCSRYVDAVARGRKRFTPRSVDELRRLVEEDLMLHREAMPAGYRKAYDRISRGLDVPRESAASATGTTTASASVRRALAHRIQRDHLGVGTNTDSNAGSEAD
ncbi:sigma-70 family RNA polymerase sigma factor [Streptomyces sp. NPDC041003]|uniref:sigma-70 family RNA polymerase sigma factor n=1 Tax=Streptomyces sp. NPDC041003 TaxID=3155730 RepID=UPI0034007677